LIEDRGAVDCLSQAAHILALPKIGDTSECSFSICLVDDQDPSFNWLFPLGTLMSSPDPQTGLATLAELSALVGQLREDVLALKSRVDALEHHASPASERRRVARTPIEVKVLLLTGRPREVPINGLAVDFSRDGFGLIVDTLFVLDSFLSVTSVKNPTGSRAEARVKSRTPHGSQWRLGCEFVQPLTDKQLEIFLGTESPAPAQG
jgi:hypothetical protein